MYIIVVSSCFVMYQPQDFYWSFPNSSNVIWFCYFHLRVQFLLLDKSDGEIEPSFVRGPGFRVTLHFQISHFEIGVWAGAVTCLYLNISTFLFLQYQMVLTIDALCHTLANEYFCRFEILHASIVLPYITKIPDLHNSSKGKLYGLIFFLSHIPLHFLTLRSLESTIKEDGSISDAKLFRSRIFHIFPVRDWSYQISIHDI